MCLPFQSAIAASLNLRSQLSLTCSSNGSIELDLKGVNFKQSWSTKYLQEIADLNEGTVYISSSYKISDKRICSTEK